MIDDWTADALQRIGGKLFATGRNAAQVFQQMDTDGDGSVSFEEFKSSLEALKMAPTFSEEEARKLFVAVDTNHSGHINYLEFLNAFRVVDSSSDMATGGSWQRSVIERVVSVLYEYRIELNAAFEKFDLDHSGTISTAEFRVGLRALTGALGSPLTDLQADELLRALDKNGDGQLSYAEFLDGFKIVDVKEEEAARSAAAAGARAARK
jgi:Ca2+-binding EF-hand superfamily protein